MREILALPFWLCIMEQLTWADCCIKNVNAQRNLLMLYQGGIQSCVCAEVGVVWHQSYEISSNR